MQAKFEKSVQTQVLMIDTERERKNEIGRNYTHPALKFGECLINEKFKPHNYDPHTASKFVLLKFPAQEFLNQLTSDYNRMNPDARPFETNFTVLDIVMPCKVSYVDDNEKVG